MQDQLKNWTKKRIEKKKNLDTYLPSYSVPSTLHNAVWIYQCCCCFFLFFFKAVEQKRKKKKWAPPYFVWLCLDFLLNFCSVFVCFCLLYLIKREDHSKETQTFCASQTLLFRNFGLAGNQLLLCVHFFGVRQRKYTCTESFAD